MRFFARKSFFLDRLEIHLQGGEFLGPEVKGCLFGREFSGLDQEQRAGFADSGLDSAFEPLLLHIFRQKLCVGLHTEAPQLQCPVGLLKRLRLTASNVEFLMSIKEN